MAHRDVDSSAVNGVHVHMCISGSRSPSFQRFQEVHGSKETTDQTQVSHVAEIEAVSSSQCGRTEA
jgi:hypothetical protein